MLSFDNMKQMSPEELEKEIPELEDAYAEALRDEADATVLNFIWSHIRAIKAELEQRVNN